ncbi:3-methyl-2-oxobutanoate hydroxymethyltransferase [Acinetobacter seifertii]|uniref:3-methyl-2-oxobutanoate hydroxymethyltransferase n=1 Tax=Acinetobacter seifertii TaxID=1530123 RepID=UPI0032B3B885
MVKIEGDLLLAESIHKLTQNGVPVCAHIGLPPQSVNVYCGFKAQGETEEQAKNLINTAKHLEEAGAAMLLIECVSSIVATQISQSVSIPVIGSGAGADTDAQVLVLPTLKIHP